MQLKELEGLNGGWGLLVSNKQSQHSTVGFSHQKFMNRFRSLLSHLLNGKLNTLAGMHAHSGFEMGKDLIFSSET